MLGVDLADPMDPFTEELFWSLLTSPKRRGAITFPDPQPTAVTPGRATGRLLGGNLALVTAIMGTPFQPRFPGAILYLEDIGEDPYRVDRMLTQLRGAGILARAAALLIGRFTDCSPRDTSSPSFTVTEVLEEYASASQRPSLAGVPFGHETVKMTLPVGIRARVDTGNRTLEYLEGAVR
jgi:muramoyltetrapeptide carboxypeptidase